MDEAFAGPEGYCRIVDDVVIFDQDLTQHASHVRSFLQRCSEKQITLNTDKWVYAKPEVDFAGFHLSSAGYRVNDAIVTAIAKFPPPTSRTDLRSFVASIPSWVKKDNMGETASHNQTLHSETWTHKLILGAQQGT